LVASRIEDGIDSIYGVSYRWNEEGTEATLVRSAGESIDFSILTPDGLRTQRWEIPSRASCLTCHTREAGFALSLDTPQLNHPGTLEGSTGNFLELLHASGYLDQAPIKVASLPRHVSPDEERYSLEARVRSYLDVNCAYCHQAGGIEPESWLGSLDLTMVQTRMINGVASGGITHSDDRMVVPGSPVRSLILSRVAATNGYSRMPPLATHENDEVAIRLLTDWIDQEATIEVNYASWRLARFGNAVSPEGEPGFDADGDGFNNESEYLALTDPLNGSVRPTLNLSLEGSGSVISFPALPNRSVLIERSADLQDWLPWSASENDGIPRNPDDASPVMTAPFSGEREYFRLRIRER
jgi:mono/diheme cytochrome c family protein